MKILKYIINEGNEPVIFSTNIIHNQVLIRGRSAGFLLLFYNTEFNFFKVICYGESTSLKLKSSPDTDEKLISDFLNT